MTQYLRHEWPILKILFIVIDKKLQGEFIELSKFLTLTQRQKVQFIQDKCMSHYI
jgi:hypothetical protein